MSVARVEPVGDAPAGLVEHDVLRPDRPLAGEGPLVEAKPLGSCVAAAFVEGGSDRRREVLGAPVAEIGLGSPQVVPVGLRLHAEPFDGDELALDAEQSLEDALRLLVAAFAEVLVADHAVRVDEVERRPVVVVEGAPDRIVVVDRDRVVDLSLLRRLLHAVDLLLEGELRRVDADHDQPVVPVGLRPRTDVRLRAQPVDAGQRPEVHEDDVAAQLGGAEWLGVEPLGRPAERGHVQTVEHEDWAELGPADPARSPGPGGQEGQRGDRRDGAGSGSHVRAGGETVHERVADGGTAVPTASRGSEVATCIPDTRTRPPGARCRTGRRGT